SGPARVASAPVAQHKRHLLALALATPVNTIAGSMEPSHKWRVLSSCGKTAAGHGRREAGVHKPGQHDGRDRHLVERGSRLR
ncbi:MAG: hypothetical protein WBW33_01965, partial [Bryobacteraceae bacterium]